MKAKLVDRTVEPLETGIARPDRLHAVYKHLRLHEGEHGVVWLILDKADEHVNTFDEAFFIELDRALDDMQRARPRALAIRSAKTSGFATGADLRMLQQATDEQSLESRILAAHKTIERIESCGFTTIAIIHGHCLGGGLELALACDYRIARSDSTFGLPEVRVGLHPGLGGTARLTRQIVPTEAMKLMLTGKSIDAGKARAIGLVDAVCEERHIANAVRMAAEHKLRHRSGGGAQAALMSIAPSRALIARRLEAETEQRVRRDHYPAPFALIELWRNHADRMPQMLDAERASFVRLLRTPTAQNLIRVFFLREHLKSLGRDGESTIKQVHVVGAGAMGADIAAWCALHGCTVTVEDTDRARLGALCRRAAALFDERAHGAERKRAYDRLIPDFKSRGVAHADLVIEAVPEKLDLKHAVYARVEPQMNERAILATNTSSITLEQLGANLARPERFVGMHFFNPVERMELVEVVEHDRCAADVLAAARSFVVAIDRLPAPVRSAPGFVVNRALMPYLVEALVLMDEGNAPETIDGAAKAFGMPMGPVELADYVGLDICIDVADRLKSEVEPPLPDIPQWLRDKVARGELGTKSGRGLYEYERGKPRKAPQRDAGNGERRDSASSTHGDASARMQDLLILPLVNACVTCLRTAAAADEDVLDAAMIFGTGFAPFRGGPIHYARARGIERIVARLDELQRERGARFAPDAGWNALR